MQRGHNVSRRDLLKIGAVGGAAMMLPLERTAHSALAITDRIPASQIPAPYQVPFVVPPVAVPVKRDAKADYFRMTMRAAKVQVLPGFPKTTIYGYDGMTPGPTIKARRGRRTVVRHINGLPRVAFSGYKPWTSVHLHGSASLPQFDGYASDITNPGEFKDYHYPNIQPARTLWYHDHGVHHTAENAYMGLAAQYHIHDEHEQSLPIPHGRYDVPLILRDAIFAKDGSLIHDDDGHSSLYGDVILVNGRPWPVMKVERRKYRFRVLNASISRSFRPALSTGDPFTVIATDAGLMPHPQEVTEYRHGQAERYEIVIDFANHKVGDKIELRNLSNPNNIDFQHTDKIMMFEVAGNASRLTDNVIPEVLDPGKKDFYNPMKLSASDATGVGASLRVLRGAGIWSINGQTWHDIEDSDYKMTVANPQLDEIQIWELENPGGGWFHPLHIHLIDFKVLSRNGQPPFPYERGPKDVVYLGENEKVRVVARFGPQTGRYMVHCHNLVHEDHDMMVQFNVGKAYSNRAHDPNDPILAAAPQGVALMTKL
jgi:spore coat protein A, manganese oxidase